MAEIAALNRSEKPVVQAKVSVELLERLCCPIVPLGSPAFVAGQRAGGYVRFTLRTVCGKTSDYRPVLLFTAITFERVLSTSYVYAMMGRKIVVPGFTRLRTGVGICDFVFRIYSGLIVCLGAGKPSLREQI